MKIINSILSFCVVSLFTASLAFADGHLEDKLKDMQTEIDTLAELIEEGGSNESTGWWTSTFVGGYGELHWENAGVGYDDSAGSASSDNQIDAHRYVIFIGHEFNKYLSFNSEFELEHGLVKDDHGELELEQMYLEQNLEYMGLNNTFIKYGVFLIPVGITNETHEPPTFYGVERNVVEKELNANTWWEGGVSAQTALGTTADVTFAVHSGLDNAAGDIRSGRGKMQEQDGSNIAYTARVRYTGIQGVELAIWHNHQTDLDNTPATGNVVANLIGGHINISPSEGFGFRALAGKWDLDCPDTHACNTNGFAKAYGAYIEPSYRWSLGGPLDSSIGIAARAGVRNDKADETANASNKVRRYDLLLNYWLSPNAVLKIDYENSKLYSSGKGSAGYNFGMGYQF
ncbi:hypothetical protein N9T15_02035 [Pelagibacteraceae bacterium]|nr:hypothetical protein [Pelagibacteraceae bacterium]